MPHLAYLGLSLQDRPQHDIIISWDTTHLFLNWKNLRRADITIRFGNMYFKLKIEVVFYLLKNNVIFHLRKNWGRLSFAKFTGNLRGNLECGSVCPACLSFFFLKHPMYDYFHTGVQCTQCTLHIAQDHYLIWDYLR